MGACVAVRACLCLRIQHECGSPYMCVSVPGGLCVLRLFHCYRHYQIVSRMPPIIDLPECSTSLLANWRGG